MRDNVLKKLENFVSRVPDNKYSKTIAAISLFDFMDIIRDDDYPIDWLDRLTGSLKNIQDGLLAQEQTILLVISNFLAMTILTKISLNKPVRSILNCGVVSTESNILTGPLSH